MLQRHFSAGGVVFKRDNNSVFWLIGKTVLSKEYPTPWWRLPKGWIDDEKLGGPGPITRGERKATEDELKAAALREVREEGGVSAEIIVKIETTRFFFTTKERERVLKFVTYYLMQWIGDLPEGFGDETSEVKWLPFEEARKILTIPGEKKILDKAKEILDSGVQSSLI